jgi:uracil-DNA glycosylase
MAGLDPEFPYVLPAELELLVWAYACPEPRPLFERALAAADAGLVRRLTALFGAAAAQDPWTLGVHPEWLEVFDARALASARSALGSAAYTPRAELVLEAFRYGRPRDVRVVIIGQDPYPGADVAQGLAFSVPRGCALPPSLRKVFECLAQSGLRPARAAECGDLSPWAAQGVLLLNTALTTRPGAPRAHLGIWRAFVAGVVGALCRRPAPLRFFLWGAEAAAFAGPARRGGHAVHLWSHPSPLADNRLAPAGRFRSCPHFASAPEIAWDNLAPAFAFCDGACAANGRPGAQAGFAVVLAGRMFGRGAAVWGRVAPREYRFLPAGAGAAALEAGDASAAPSNNRAELLAVAHGLLALLRARVRGRVELVTDSRIAVQTLREWLPARRARGTAGELKNLDLLEAAEALLVRLRARAAKVVLTHVPGHAPRPPAAPGKPPTPRAVFLWKGNRAADALAVRARRLEPGPPWVAERGAETWGALA